MTRRRHISQPLLCFMNLDGKFGASPKVTARERNKILRYKIAI
jgi:hypothetical protein